MTRNRNRHEDSRSGQPARFSSWLWTLCLAFLSCAANGSDSDAAILEEVIVTATKRDVPIQEVPVSILAIDGEELARDALLDLEQYSAFVPNLHIGDAIYTTAVSIRGLGSPPERSLEQSVGLFTDGVYMPRSRQYRTAFLDVERVEVMRGPQAVLHGLNSTAGAISIVTRRNHGGDPLRAEVTGEYEAEDGGYRLSAVLGGSATDSLGLRLAARVSRLDDFYRNDATGREESGSEETATRLSATWQPRDDLLFDASVELGTSELDGHLGEQWGPASLQGTQLLGLDVSDDGRLDWRRDMAASFQPALAAMVPGRDRPGMEQDHAKLALDSGYILNDGHRVSALLAHSESDWTSYLDGDATALPILDGAYDEDYQQNSAEIRFTSETGGLFDYIFGLYYLDSRLESDLSAIIEPTFTLAPGAYGFDQVFTRSAFVRDVRLNSLFATGTWHPTDRWHLSLGLRYAEDKRRYRRQSDCLPVRNDVIVGDPSPTDQATIDEYGPNLLCASLDGYSDSRRSDNWMPELAASWDLNEDVRWYGKVSSSVKAGGWAAALVATGSLIEYDDEAVTGWELGMRSHLRQRAMSLNFAVFQTDLDDMQVVDYVPGIPQAGVINAPKARSRGFETDISWQATASLRLFLSYAYLDASFRRFPNARCPASKQLTGATSFCDASGKALPLAPEHSIGARADIRRRLASGPVIRAGLNIGYRSDYLSEATLEPALAQDSYLTWGARFGLEAADGHWALSLVGTNLGNEAVLNYSIRFINNLGYLRSPRRVWLQATWRLGAGR